MTFTRESAAIESRPTPTPEQTAQARRYVEAHAPDLIDAIFGDDTTKENN